MKSGSPIEPRSAREAAEALRELAASGGRVRIAGAGTKRSWSEAGAGAIELRTRALDRIVEHNAGDLTAVVEAGVPLAEAQEQFARAGQMLAIDPPLGMGSAATIGGVVATADGGPLRHRFGPVRDLVIGISVVLADGAASKSGGKVIKNVAGYDMAKLFAGSFGTLGLVTSVTVRLHPRPQGSATAVARAGEASRMAAAAVAIAARPLEADCVDAEWRDGSGSLLVRFSGATAGDRAASVAQELGGLGLEDADVISPDEPLWTSQRLGQRSAKGTVVKVSALPTDLSTVIEAADSLGAGVVSRACLGISYLSFDEVAPAPGAIRERLAPLACTVLDRPAAIGQQAWARVDPGAARVMAALKSRLDPAGILPPPPIAGPA